MAPPKAKLPIDAHLPAIVDAFEKNKCVLIKSSPGSGKTTRVPAAILSSIGRHGDQVIVLEPRRLAAKLAAEFVAEENAPEWNAEPTPGGKDNRVGYQFRFESRVSPTSQILFLTEGTFLRILAGNPKLKGVAAVILDEFHERHEQTDIALAQLLHVQSTTRPDLKLGIMSATLDTAKLERHLTTHTSSVHKIEVELPRFSLEVAHRDLVLDPTGRDYMSAVAKSVAQSVAAATERMDKGELESGDILVFLPGGAEIRACQARLEQDFSPRALRVATLHGLQERAEQNAALKTGQQRKVILSTNIAESSVTIDGVRCVIDSGLYRQASASTWTGLPVLRTKKIPKASAIQRAGRAARQGPGTCIRLYSEQDFRTRVEFESPEILRSDLAPVVLDLKALSLEAESVRMLPWLDAPSQQAFTSAETLLYQIGALEDQSADSALTEIGRKLASLSMHPRMGRALIEAAKQGCAEEMARKLAALDIENTAGQSKNFDEVGIERNENAERMVTRWLKELGQLQTVTKTELSREACEAKQKLKPKLTPTLQTALLSGFPDRVGLARTPNQYALSGGGEATLRDVSLHDAPKLLIVLDAMESGGKNSIRVYSEVKEEWLWEHEPHLLEEKTLIANTNPTGKRASFKKTIALRFLNLVLEEKGAPLDLDFSETDRQAVALAVFEECTGLPFEKAKTQELPTVLARLQPDWLKDAIEAQLARMQFAAKMTGATYNDVDLLKMIPFFFEGYKSVSEMESKELSTIFTRRADDHPQAPKDLTQKLSHLLPSEIQLRTKRKLALHYTCTPKGPEVHVAARIQEFFGSENVPAIWQGKLPLTIHLLSPAYRPVQVTSDLKGFWERSYPALRKELARNYPKHQWPENPATYDAPPTRH